MDYLWLWIVGYLILGVVFAFGLFSYEAVVRNKYNDDDDVLVVGGAFIGATVVWPIGIIMMIVWLLGKLLQVLTEKARDRV